MGVVQRFERRLGDLVEGAFAKVFKADVQPVEIASALTREADDKRRILSSKRIVVPNDYVVELGSHDFGELIEWSRQLDKEFSQLLREHAAEEGYGFVGPVHVELEQVADLDTGRFRIRSGVTEGSSTDGESALALGAQAATDRAAARDAPSDALPHHPRLTVAAGGTALQGTDAARGEESVYFLRSAVTVIGRGRDVDLPLDDPGVSRRHAEIRQEGDHFWVVDLGSTNGVTVDGAITTRAPLSTGKRITLGSTTLVFAINED